MVSALVRSPREAVQAFASQPKQRNLFVVRFIPNGAQTQANSALLTSLTFIAKSVERPKINTKIEELHQYNKKRQVYTGFKLEPVRFTFYDDAKSSASQMWQNYVGYYFGDFTGIVTSSSSVKPYAYDVILAQMQSMNFGFTGGPDGPSDFYFDRIEIYQFYDQVYDVYQLINPRIVSFDPDQLEYSNSDISLIAMSVAYENLQFAFNQSTKNGDVNGVPFLEFVATNGGGQMGTFDGNVIPIAQVTAQPITTNPATLPSSSSMPINSLIASAPGAVAGAPSAPYRYVSAQSTGPLGQYGNYQYGPTVQQSLAAVALTNPALATALDMGANTDPLALTQASLQATANTLANRGVSGAQLDVVLPQVQSAMTGSGTTTNTVTKAILASNALQGGTNFWNGSNNNNNNSVVRPNGVVMTPQAYGVTNTQQTGTSQVGFNINTTPSGSSSGYTGSSGYQGPVGQENNGPYSGNLPNGLYGRYGITVEPLGNIGIPANPVTAAA